MLNEKQFVLGATLFILFIQLEDNSYNGKRVIKKINRTIKKKLAIMRNEWPVDKYLKLVNICEDVIKVAKRDYTNLIMIDETDEQQKWESTVIVPGQILRLLHFRYNDLIDIYEIDKELVDELITKYTDTSDSVRFNSTRFANLLIDSINSHEKKIIGRA